MTGQRQRVLLTGGNVPIADGKSYTSFNDLWAFDGMRWEALPSSGLEVWGMRTRLRFAARTRLVVRRNQQPPRDIRRARARE